MAKLSNYKGSIDLISGLRAKNEGDFPLMEAHDILVDENGQRLDEKLESIGEGVTHEWSGTVLSVTSASGTSSADLKGEKGDQGAQGEKGEKGDTGAQGEQGEKGDKGDTGADGVSVTHSWDGTVLTITSASGTSSADLKGEKGDSGSGGSGGGIIDVTELPTENIDEQSIYRIVSGAKVYLVGMGNAPIDMEEYSTQNDGILHIYVADDAQTCSKAVSQGSIMHFYVDRSTGIAYCELPAGVMSAGVVLGQMLGSTIPDNGWSQDIATEATFGLYAVPTSYSYHACKDGMWAELPSGGLALKSLTMEGGRSGLDKLLLYMLINEKVIPHSLAFEGSYSYSNFNDSEGTNDQIGFLPFGNIVKGVASLADGDTVPMAQLTTSLISGIAMTVTYSPELNNVFHVSEKHIADGKFYTITSAGIDYSNVTSWTLYYF